jgi:gamma-glutamyltranspeptidase/glutathione hydrolase
MKRRSFLKLMGGVGASAVWARNPSFTETSTLPEESRDVPINAARLQNRNQNRSTVVCQHGMVCTSQPLASMAGVDILKVGGNAIDAAVSANAVLSVVEPMMCGPGGDLFAIVWSEKDQKLFGLNASARSPYDWNLDRAAALGLSEIPAYSPLAWSVPGCASGWGSLLQRFGKLSLARALEPAIFYAREGFPVSPIIACSWSVDAEKHPTAAKTFMPEGRSLRFGDMFRNPDLARFFELLARDGARSFYEGEIAERIVAFSKAHGGLFSMRDFCDHKDTWVDPVSANYRGYDVWELPPNTQGIAVLQILNILEQFDIALLKPNSAEHLHLFIEAKKLAFEDRAVYYADMDFADVPLKQLVSKGYARERANLINPNRAAENLEPGAFPCPSETTYLTAADSEGNMVSLIQSIFHEWGSRYVPDGLGFCLQNRGQLLSLNPQHQNKLEPHKRPFHTIIPGFVTRDGKPVFSFGVMGGDFQPQGQVQVLINIVDFGMSPQQAGEQPRVEHYESSTPTGRKMTGGGSVGFERGIPDDVKLRLAEMGHRIRPGVGVFGGYQGIWRKENPRRYFGGSDPRKDGCAVGY